jgi:hypothetical protein
VELQTRQEARLKGGGECGTRRSVLVRGNIERPLTLTACQGKLRALTIPTCGRLR